MLSRSLARPATPRALHAVAFGACVWLPAAASAQSTVACRVVDRLDQASLSSAWRKAVESLTREVIAAVGSGAAPCSGIDLVLTPEGGSVRVTARALDGRETGRLVPLPAGLSAIAFGLLAVAPGEAIPAPADPHEIPPPPDPVVVPVPTPPLPPAWVLSFSASTGVRAVFPTDVLVAEFDVRADLALHDWLVTFRVRAAPLVLAMRGPYDEDAYDEAGVGLGLGRQLRLGRSVLELTGEANVTFIWLENDVLNLDAERAQARLAAVARWTYPVSHALRVNADVDGEISPTGLVNASAAPGLASLPVFTLGLRIGGEVLL